MPGDAASGQRRSAGRRAFAFDLGRVGTGFKSCLAMIAYDDEYSIDFMGQKLRPYWRRNGMDAAALMRAAARDYAALDKKCAAFDRDR